MSNRNLEFPFFYSYIHNNFPFLPFDTNNNPDSFNYCFPLNFSNPWRCRTLVCSLLLFGAMRELRCRKTAPVTGVLDTSSSWAFQELSKITFLLISFIFKLSAWWHWWSTYRFNLTALATPVSPVEALGYGFVHQQPAKLSLHLLSLTCCKICVHTLLLTKIKWPSLNNSIFKA